jgi:WD40 repeat protein
VALGSNVYTWDAGNSRVTKLTDTGEQNSISSVNFSKAGTELAVGLNSGLVQVWDLET